MAYVNDTWSRLGAAPDERGRFRVPTPKPPTPPPTARIIPSIVSRVKPFIVSRSKTKTMIVSATKPTVITRPTPYVLKAKMAVERIKDAPAKGLLPVIISKMNKPAISDYYRKPVAKPAAPVATLTTTSSGKAAIEIAPAKNAGTPLISQDKPLVELVEKPTEASLTASPTTQDWIKYGMIAVGVFILTKTFASSGSVRRKVPRYV